MSGPVADKGVILSQNEFIRLSAVLTFQHGIADAKRAGRLLDTVVPRGPLPEGDRRILKEVVDFVLRAYGARKRRLGTLAVLHPLRTAALLAAPHGPALLPGVLVVRPAGEGPEPATCMGGRYCVTRIAPPQPPFPRGGNVSVDASHQRLGSRRAWIPAPALSSCHHAAL